MMRNTAPRSLFAAGEWPRGRRFLREAAGPSSPGRVETLRARSARWRRPPPPRLRIQAARACPPSRRDWRHCRRRSTRGAVGLRSRQADTWRAAETGIAAATTGSATSNQKRLPQPGLLSTWSLPPIRSTRLRLMARPRPVPHGRGRRLVSDLRERLEQFRDVVGAMPDAGVADGEADHRSASRRLQLAARKTPRRRPW